MSMLYQVGEGTGRDALERKRELFPPTSNPQAYSSCGIVYPQCPVTVVSLHEISRIKMLDFCAILTQWAGNKRHPSECVMVPSVNQCPNSSVVFSTIMDFFGPVPGQPWEEGARRERITSATHYSHQVHSLPQPPCPLTSSRSHLTWSSKHNRIWQQMWSIVAYCSNAPKMTTVRIIPLAALLW